MNFRRNTPLICAIAAVLAVATVLVPMADALKVPPGRYVGTARGVVLKDKFGKKKHNDMDMILNLSGNRIFRGRIRTSQSGAVGFPFNTKIFGKIRKSEIRQGGGKWVIDGRWTFKLNVNRLDKRARGRFKATIHRRIDDSVDPAVFTYQCRWPFRVGHRGGGGPDAQYTYRGRFRGNT